MHRQEEKEKRGDIHPLFSLILGIKVIQSKWLKRDMSLFIPHGKEEGGKKNLTNIPALVTNNLIIVWNTSVTSV